MIFLRDSALAKAFDKPNDIRRDQQGHFCLDSANLKHWLLELAPTPSCAKTRPF